MPIRRTKGKSALLPRGLLLADFPKHLMLTCQSADFAVDCLSSVTRWIGFEGRIHAPSEDRGKYSFPTGTRAVCVPVMFVVASRTRTTRSEQRSCEFCSRQFRSNGQLHSVG